MALRCAVIPQHHTTKLEEKAKPSPAPPLHAPSYLPSAGQTPLLCAQTAVRAVPLPSEGAGNEQRIGAESPWLPGRLFWTSLAGLRSAVGCQGWYKPTQSSPRREGSASAHLGDSLCSKMEKHGGSGLAHFYDLWPVFGFGAALWTVWEKSIKKQNKIKIGWK